jgi:hypothetical protein
VVTVLWICSCWWGTLVVIVTLLNAHPSEYFLTTFCSILEKEVNNLRVRRMIHNLVLKFFLLENEFFKLLCVWCSNWAAGFTIWGSIPDRGKRFFPSLKCLELLQGLSFFIFYVYHCPFSMVLCWSPTSIRRYCSEWLALCFCSSFGPFVACARTALSLLLNRYVQYKGGHCTVL